MTQTIAITGARGFLGWHTRAAALESNTRVIGVPLGRQFDLAQATEALSKSNRVVHIAGVNRGTDSEIQAGNVQLASQLAQAMTQSQQQSRTVVFANSIQAANRTVYGEAKAEAASILERATLATGSAFTDVRLPNLFGEHGRPFYNAVTATFAHMLANGGQPVVESDKSLTLLHAQDAADLLLGNVGLAVMGDMQREIAVSALLAKLERFAEIYRGGEIPNIASKFDRDLFNTYRSHTVDSHLPIRLTRHADVRGSFFEIVRGHGGTSQSSFSTTVPGVSRGDHFHRRKVERFTVLAGQAVISLRKLFSGEVVDFVIDGDSPIAIDMPTMWAHKITNVGQGDLYTSFWSNDIFDPVAPDTIPEMV